MTLFDQLVDQALVNQRSLAPLRVVVEKELLHHDIFVAMSRAGMLADLTFIGGTCLRACYGSQRLSEDLDFAGGTDFERSQLVDLAAAIETNLQAKYGLHVDVSEPTRETGNVSTWKVKVETRPNRKDLPAQRINIDICAVPSYDAKPRLLLNPYGVDMGTTGLILRAESLEEIYIDKLLAFALRPNRIKYRDLWDISWLHQRGVVPAWGWLGDKLNDHACPTDVFLEQFQVRLALLASPGIADEFRHEMARFLPGELRERATSPEFWSFVSGHMTELLAQARRMIGLF